MLTNHYQNAYVTADIDRAVAMLVEQFGPVGEPRRIDGGSQMFRGTNGEGVAKMRVALIQVGKLQYELIQPVSGNVAIYADALVPDRVMTFHHVAMRTDDLDKMRAEVTRLGYPIVAEGEARGGIRLFYADARKSFGHYLEYVWAPDAVWGDDRCSGCGQVLQLGNAPYPATFRRAGIAGGQGRYNAGVRGELFGLIADTLKEVETIPDNWRECSHCGLISILPVMCPELTADCPRCHHVLWRMRGCNFELPLACALAGALFFFYAVIAPFLEISSYGQFQLARLVTGPYQLAQQGFDTVGLLVLGVSVILPGAKLLIILVTLTGLETHLLPRGILKDIFRWYEPIKPWAMVDVYLLGFLVAYTRLSVIATVHLDTALFALVGLMISTVAVNAFLDTEAVWRVLDSGVPEPRECLPGPLDDRLLIGCPSCSIVNRARPGDSCRRCDAVLEARKPASFGRSWAFIAAAAILYVPANIYPVMTLSNLVQSRDYTIMGGIFELFQRGLWPLGLLVFFASILIPVVKLLTLATMLIETHLQSEQHLVGRTISFRFVDFIGRWSMIDVFMISILVAVVRFGKFSSVQAQLGAPCFAAVVVLTMFAVNAFDPRLMWDRAAEHHARLGRHAATGQA